MSGIQKLHDLLDAVIDCCADEFETAKQDGFVPNAVVFNTALSLFKMNNITPDVDDGRMQVIDDEFKEERAIARQKKAESIIAQSNGADSILFN